MREVSSRFGFLEEGRGQTDAPSRSQDSTHHIEEMTTPRDRIMSKPEPDIVGRTTQGHQSHYLATSEDFRFCPPTPKPKLIPLSNLTIGESTLSDGEPPVTSSNPLVGVKKTNTGGESLNTCQRRQGSEPLSEADTDQITAHVC